MTAPEKTDLEKSILWKVGKSIESHQSLKINHRLVSAVQSGDALEAVRELTVMAPDLGTEKLRQRFVSPLGERHRNAVGEAAQSALRQVSDDVSQLLDAAGDTE